MVGLVIAMTLFPSGVIQFTGRVTYQAWASNPELEDWLDIPATCRGCKHYEGGPNHFHCGMHPVGVQEDDCPDFQLEPE